MRLKDVSELLKVLFYDNLASSWCFDQHKKLILFSNPPLEWPITFPSFGGKCNSWLHWLIPKLFAVVDYKVLQVGKIIQVDLVLI